MNRSSAAAQETLSVSSGLRRSSARQAPMSCWRRGGGGSGGGIPSSLSDREVSGSSASGKARVSGSSSSLSLEGGGSIEGGEGRGGEARVGREDDGGSESGIGGIGLDSV